MPTCRPDQMIAAADDRVEERIAVAGGEITIVRPNDFEDLLTEEAFEREELLPYWARLWGSALALAEAVAERVRAGERVLELGCGLGLPSIAAARAGASVTASDWSPDAVRATAANATRNGVELDTLAADWDAPAALVERAPWDLVIAADVLYERKKVSTLLDLLPRLAETVLLAEPGRLPAESFFGAARGAWENEEVSVTGAPRVVVHLLSRLRNE